MSTVESFDLHQSSAGDLKMNHHTCKSAKRTLAGAGVKCYNLLVGAKVVSNIDKATYDAIPKDGGVVMPL
jgi:hypothetical protein